MLYIDRSRHDHGPHNTVDRLLESHAKSLNENTPHNGADLAAVHEAEFIPQCVDGSLRGSIQHWLEEGSDHARPGTNMYGREVYHWPAEALARLFGRRNQP